MILDKGTPCRMDQPAQLGLGPECVDSRDHGKRMDDIAEGTGLHQQDAGGFSHRRLQRTGALIFMRCSWEIPSFSSNARIREIMEGDHVFCPSS